MKIKKLDIKGFGRFKDKTIELGDGFNIIQGHNESGKTTMQRFILAMFYGFTDPNFIHRRFIPDHSQLRPWNTETYAGSLEYHLGGAYYLIERNFNEKDYGLRLLEARTGIDQTSRYPTDRRGEVLFAEEQLGFNKMIFTNTIFIGQLASRSEKELVKEVSEKIINIEQAGIEKISIDKILASINQSRKDLNTRLQPSLQTAKIKVEETLKEQEKMKALLAKKQETRVKIIDLQKRLTQLNNLRERTENKLVVLQYKKIEDQLRKIEEYEKRNIELQNQIGKQRPLESFPLEDEAVIISIEENIKIRNEQIQQIKNKEAELKAKLAQIEAELKEKRQFTDFKEDSAAELRLLYQDLAELNEEISRQAKSIEDCQAQLEIKKHEIKNSFRGIDTLNPDDKTKIKELDQQIKDPEVRLQEKELQFTRERLDHLISQRGQKAGNIIFSLFAAIAILVIAYFIPLPTNLLGLSNFIKFLLPLPALFFLISLLQRMKIKKKIQELEILESELMESRRTQQKNMELLQQERRRLFDRAGITSVNELDEKWESYREISQEAEQLKRELASLNSRLQKSRASAQEKKERIKETLNKAGILTGASPASDDVDTFHSVLEKHFYKEREKNILTQRMVELQHELQSLRTIVAEAQEKRLHLFNNAGVADLTEFNEKAQQHRRFIELQKEHKEVITTLNALLEGTDRSQLKVYQNKALPLLSSKNYADLSLDDYPALEKEYEGLEKEIYRTEQEEAILTEQVKTQNTYVADCFQVEHNLNLWESIFEDLKLKDEALDTAIRIIKMINREKQMEFAPRLNQEAAAIVNHITNGKYNFLQIDKNLNISLLEPGRQRYIDLSSVSMGTVDQVYFAFRIALADILYKGSGRLPLILDDSFTQYDDDRLLKVMELLMSFSRERQVILFCARQKELDVINSLPGAATATKISLG